MGSPHCTLNKKSMLQVLFATLVALSSAASPPAPYAPQETYPDLPPVYNYQYGVNDPEYSGAVFSQQENRADYDTSGEYRVNLPDGRVQIVTYTAGPEGYVADVKYEGEAVYAEVKPYFGSKKFGSKKFLGSKYFWGSKKIWVKKIFLVKKNLGKN